MTNKHFVFVSGLPRSGSTLLQNILAQNPRHYVTPTSGIIDILVNIRNQWTQNSAFKALPPKQSEELLHNVLRYALEGYFAHTDKQVCFDKSRGWLEYMEMAAAIVGTQDKVKCLVTVRDLRD